MTFGKNDRWRYISSGGLWFLWKKKFRHVLPLNCVWGRGEIWRRCICTIVLVLVLYLSLSLWGREIWHTTHPGPVLFPCHWKEGQLLMPFHYAKIGLRWASYIDHGDDDHHDLVVMMIMLNQQCSWWWWCGQLLMPLHYARMGFLLLHLYYCTVYLSPCPQK